MKDQMRTFVALELTSRIRSSLSRQIEILRQTGAEVKWVAPEGLHVTLKFLGEVKRARIGEVIGTVEAAVAGLEPFEIEAMGVSFFPRPERPRVVAAGIDADGAGRLAEMAGRIDQAIADLGFKKEERPFKSHVTLGRVKSPRGIRGLADAILTAPGESFGRQEVDEIVVFMSELSRAGPTYTPLGRVRIGT